MYTVRELNRSIVFFSESLPSHIETYVRVSLCLCAVRCLRGVIHITILDNEKSHNGHGGFVCLLRNALLLLPEPDDTIYSNAPQIRLGYIHCANIVRCCPCQCGSLYCRALSFACFVGIVVPPPSSSPPHTQTHTIAVKP